MPLFLATIVAKKQDGINADFLAAGPPAEPASPK
jgi:hypothetical protein